MGSPKLPLCLTRVNKVYGFSWHGCNQKTHFYEHTSLEVLCLFQGSLSREHFFLPGCGIEIELLEKPTQSASSVLLPIFPLFLTKPVKNPRPCKIKKLGCVRLKVRGSVQRVGPVGHDKTCAEI